MQKYRADIDGLRALAILAVVAFHAYPGHLTGGFVGVDVFFVISGYLISGIIQDGLAAGRFSFWKFYGHRIRRLFPALSLMLAVMLALGWLLMLPDEYARLGGESLAGAGFVANFHFWFEASIAGGYFDLQAAQKPLLHLWSLGVEEQFYLAWPIAMLLLWRWRLLRPATIAALGLGSFALCIMVARYHPVAAFYAPATRIWEILAGAWLQSLSRQDRSMLSPPLAHAASLAGLALILAACLVAAGTVEANVAVVALAPVIGALLVISAGPGAWGNRLLALRPAAYLGRISYPLYLWHWPLLSLAAMATYGQPPTLLRAALLVASLVLAVLTHELLEKPVHRRSVTWPLCLGLLAMVALLGIFGSQAQDMRRRLVPQLSYFSQDRLSWPPLENDVCAADFQAGQARWVFCVANTARPRILLFGNSHSNHLYPGFAAVPSLGRQGLLNLGGCWPAWGIFPVAARTMRDNACLHGDAQKSQLAHLGRKLPSLRYAVLAANWPHFAVDGSERDFFSGAPAETFYSVPPSTRAPRDTYVMRLEDTIGMLEGQGLRVVLTLDVPRLPYDVRSCLERPYIRPRQDCRLEVAVQKRARAQFLLAVRALQRRHPSMLVFDPLPAFCDESVCRMVEGQSIFMRDDNHLSLEGSLAVAHLFERWARGAVPGMLAPP